ncbi:MAG: hypothetical protein ACLFM7_06360 [Bacteroidales bacterium]
MEIQSVDMVFNSNVMLHVIPGNLSSQMTMSWKETEERFRGKHDLLDFVL